MPQEALSGPGTLRALLGWSGLHSRLLHYGLGPPGGSFPCRKSQASSLGSRRNAGAHLALRGFTPKRMENEWDREILPQVLPQLKTGQWSSKKNISQETKPNQVANPMPSYFVSFLCPSQCHLTILGSSCSALKPLFQSNGNYWGNGVSSQFLAVCPSPGKDVCTHTYSK